MKKGKAMKAQGKYNQFEIKHLPELEGIRNLCEELKLKHQWCRCIFVPKNMDGWLNGYITNVAIEAKGGHIFYHIKAEDGRKYRKVNGSVDLVVKEGDLVDMDYRTGQCLKKKELTEEEVRNLMAEEADNVGRKFVYRKKFSNVSTEGHIVSLRWDKEQQVVVYKVLTSAGKSRTVKSNNKRLEIIKGKELDEFGAGVKKRYVMSRKYRSRWGNCPVTQDLNTPEERYLKAAEDLKEAKEKLREAEELVKEKELILQKEAEILLKINNDENF